MSLEIVNKDTTALPTALLDLAKKQMRVTFSEDDDLIKAYIGQAIDYFEVFSALAVFDTEAVWTPNEYDEWKGEGRVLCPIQPIREWTAADADGEDVTAAFKLTGTSSGSGRAAGIYLVPASGTTIATGTSLTITAGFEDQTQLPPSMLNLVLRSAARLYEDRESTTTDGLEAVPDWMMEMFAGYWVPRV